MTAPVSAVVLTYNEEPNIEACLRSVAGWAQEIVVVDSGSTDRTCEIARTYTDKLHEHPYVDHSKQWKWALDNLPLECDWVLALDADNVVSDTLKRQISHALAHDDGTVHGYFSVHTHYFRNRRIRGLKKYWLRLIRRSRTRLDETELVDFRFVVDGPTRSLTGEISESNQKELSIDFWINKHQKFASRMAIEEVLRRAGHIKWTMKPRLLGNHDERMIWFKSRWYRGPLFVRPVLYFIYRYVFRAGFLDGRNGFAYHLLQALWFRLIVDLRIQELERELAAGLLTLDDLASRAR